MFNAAVCFSRSALEAYYRKINIEAKEGITSAQLDCYGISKHLNLIKTRSTCWLDFSLADF